MNKYHSSRGNPKDFLSLARECMLNPLLFKIKIKVVSQCPKFTVCFVNIPVTFGFTSGSSQVQSRIG